MEIVWRRMSWVSEGGGVYGMGVDGWGEWMMGLWIVFGVLFRYFGVIDG